MNTVLLAGKNDRCPYKNIISCRFRVITVAIGYRTLLIRYFQARLIDNRVRAASVSCERAHQKIGQTSERAGKKGKIKDHRPRKDQRSAINEQESRSRQALLGNQT